MGPHVPETRVVWIRPWVGCLCNEIWARMVDDRCVFGRLLHHQRAFYDWLLSILIIRFIVVRSIINNTMKLACVSLFGADRFYYSVWESRDFMLWCEGQNSDIQWLYSNCLQITVSRSIIHRLLYILGWLTERKYPLTKLSNGNNNDFHVIPYKL